MASNHARLPLRNRALAQRAKADENATSRHIRQPSASGPSGLARLAQKDIIGLKQNQARTVLNEVTTTAVNRKDTVRLVVGGKDKEETGLKRGRSNSSATVAQRVPLGPNKAQVAPPIANVVPARAPLAPLLRTTRPQIPILGGSRRAVPRVAPEPVVQQEEEIQEELIDHDDMDVEEDIILVHREEHMEAALVDEHDDSLANAELEVEAMMEDIADEVLEEDLEAAEPRASSVWPQITPERAVIYEKRVQAVRDEYEDDGEDMDPTMVSEYAEEIFEYMNELEEQTMPSPDYINHQQDMSWEMRQTLVDWLLQVHLRYHLLPETLWIAINIVDRFLSKRVVSKAKIQLVGVTAMFIASKYEEILAPSVDEFAFITENGYTKEEILKGERIVLQTLEFRISHYCSPYSWMRKISRADDYDLQTRTLSKFLTEVTLLDYRFLRVKPHQIAAVGMYSARIMLGGDWNTDFIYHSGYTEEQLIEGHQYLVQKLAETNFHRNYLYKKYAHKKFLKASVFAMEWARGQIIGGSGMNTRLDDE